MMNGERYEEKIKITPILNNLSQHHHHRNIMTIMTEKKWLKISHGNDNDDSDNC